MVPDGSKRVNGIGMKQILNSVHKSDNLFGLTGKNYRSGGWGW